MRRWRLGVARFVARVWFPALCAFVVLAVALHLTVRDRFYGPSVLFYATPYPVLALISAGGLIVTLALRRWRRVLIPGALLLLTLGLHVATSVEPFRIQKPRGIELLFWNPSRGSWGHEGIFELVEKLRPDFVGFVEAGAKGELSPEKWRQRLPGYEVRKLKGGMLVLTRGRIESARFHKGGPAVRFNELTVTLGTERLRVILSDLPASPLRNRAPGFRLLETLLAGEKGIPTVVMGDFNTPLESVHFRTLRQNGFTHAFEEAGAGRVETWPRHLPILALDHVWAGPGVDVTSCRYYPSRSSDHLAVRVTVIPD